MPLVITLFPGVLEQALHGYESVVQTCAAALYGIGRELPPLGLVVLTLLCIALLNGVLRITKVLARTRQLERAATPTPLPLAVDRTARVLGLSDRLRTYTSDTPEAYTSGLLRPRIWISLAAVSSLRPDELRAVLLHERAHLLRRDPLRVLIVRTLSAFLVAAPLVRDLARRFEIAKELDADRDAIEVCGAPALAGALEALGRTRPLDAAVSAWSLTSIRIDQLEGCASETLLPGVQRSAHWVTLLAVVLAIALASGQALRANLVPAAALGVFGIPAGGVTVHECPLPMEGVLF